MKVEGRHRSSREGQSISLLSKDTADPADDAYETDSDTICVIDKPLGERDFHTLEEIALFLDLTFGRSLKS